MTQSSGPEADVLIEVADGVGHLTLNRPRAINALTQQMCVDMADALTAWAGDDAVTSVELRGAGERGLCSGADVRGLRQLVLDGGDHQRFFEVEYRLNELIASYPKPYVAHMAGVTMGGGLGVSAHGSRRVAYPDSTFAMPETNIGFEPDVGIMFLLARAPGELGTHLALTGTSVGAEDGVLVGLADEVDGDAPPGVLAGQRGWIDECYRGHDPVAIVRRLEQHDDPAARAAADDIRRRCPLSVAVSLEALRRAARMDNVAQVLAQDLVLADHLIGGPDFVEGVRAQLVDKDKDPHWSHARLEDVTRDEVLAAFGEA
ncbi:enoyl-CoA hydratase/isomerase family protein [Nigerium massiliense]|uniref:enoyl-CoA hydratase/isomerase family protein n=1 Tax=Nigerium massiliense TaxID=1522317 RepID=UPI00058F7381|nr:enoyl-CoA hydratase/isomerase family protein [Nigerium massiliense]